MIKQIFISSDEAELEIFENTTNNVVISIEINGECLFFAFEEESDFDLFLEKAKKLKEQVYG